MTDTNKPEKVDTESNEVTVVEDVSLESFLGVDASQKTPSISLEGPPLFEGSETEDSVGGDPLAGILNTVDEAGADVTERPVKAPSSQKRTYVFLVVLALGVVAGAYFLNPKSSDIPTEELTSVPTKEATGGGSTTEEVSVVPATAPLVSPAKNPGPALSSLTSSEAPGQTQDRSQPSANEPVTVVAAPIAEPVPKVVEPVKEGAELDLKGSSASTREEPVETPPQAMEVADGASSIEENTPKRDTGLLIPEITPVSMPLHEKDVVLPGDFFLQIGAYMDQKYLEQVQKKVESQGLHTWIEPRDVLVPLVRVEVEKFPEPFDGKTLNELQKTWPSAFRVLSAKDAPIYLGSYANETTAQAMVDDFRAKGGRARLKVVELPRTLSVLRAGSFSSEKAAEERALTLSLKGEKPLVVKRQP